MLADVLPVLLHISSRHRAALRRLPSGGRLTLNQITRILFPVYWTVARCRRNSVMWLLRPALLKRNRSVDASSSDYLIVLRAGLKKVDPKQFQIFDCYVRKEWPAQKVADQLRVNVGQVYLARHRVSALLKKEIRALEKLEGRAGS